MTDEILHLKKILEGAILAAGEPLTLEKMQTLFAENEIPEKEILLKALEAIKSNCEDCGFDLVEVASGWRFIVREDIATWVNRLWEEKPQKYSRALLETLALIAYRQPITRGDIEEVRGVAVSSHIIKTLTEREWVKVVGSRDVPGRPSLYATTKKFLDYFNLKSLEELPTLGELKDIDSLNKALDFEGQPPVDDKELSEINQSGEEIESESNQTKALNFEEEISTEDSSANQSDSEDTKSGGSENADVNEFDEVSIEINSENLDAPTGVIESAEQMVSDDKNESFVDSEPNENLTETALEESPEEFSESEETKKLSELDTNEDTN